MHFRDPKIAHQSQDCTDNLKIAQQIRAILRLRNLWTLTLVHVFATSYLDGLFSHQKKNYRSYWQSEGEIHCLLLGANRKAWCMDAQLARQSHERKAKKLLGCSTKILQRRSIATRSLYPAQLYAGNWYSENRKVGCGQSQNCAAWSHNFEIGAQSWDP